jgi:hypothetical protein
VNNELGHKRKEAAVATFQILSLHLPGESEENDKDPRDNRSLGRDITPEVSRI